MAIERIRQLLIALVVLAFAATLAACSRSPTVRFYTLSEAQITAAPGTSDLSVSVGPAVFPRALARNQIVTRLGDTQLTIDEYNVWAAPLDSAFLDVLGNNIARQLGSDQVITYPAEAPFEVDYKVLLDVLQFDGVLGESATLRVRWALMQAGSVVKVATFSSTQTIEGDGSDYDALVAAYSALTAELSQSIVAELSSLSQQAKP